MVVQEHPAWECFLDVGNQIGEAPVWSADENALYWIDALASPTTLNRFAGGSTRSWSFPDRIGTWALTTDGSWVLAALRSGIYRLDLETDALHLLHEPPYDPERFQFNDGRCDRDGNFWVGTMAVDFANTPTGSDTLWRLGEDGLTQRADAITLSNGTAFSPSGDVLYIADSPTASIWAFDHDPTDGTLLNRRVYARLSEGEFPDGAAVDADGFYWVAVFGAGRILRFRPDGTMDRDLRAPVSHPTMVCFGGSEYRQLYMTSGRFAIDRYGFPEEPNAGGVFTCDVGAQGLPEPRFRFSGQP